MAKCMKCGSKKRLMASHCDRCIKEFEKENAAQWEQAQREEREQLLDYASAADYGRNAQEIPDTDSIRALLREDAIRGAIRWMFFWGIVNLGAWYFFIRSDADFQALRGNLSSDQLAIAFSGALVGCGMLAFAAIGSLTNWSTTGYVAGFSLVGVGILNLISDLTARAAQATATGGFHLWGLLGVWQMVWGGRQLARFSRLSGESAKSQSFDGAALRARLVVLLGAPSDPQAGRIKCSIRRSFPMIEEHTFVMWLLPDRAVTVSQTGQDVLVFDRRKSVGRRFKGDQIDVAAYDGTMWSLHFGESDRIAFQDWCATK